MNLKKKILTKFNSKNFQFRDNDKEIIFFLDNQTNFVPYLNSFFRWKFNLEQILDKYKEVYDFSGILRFNNEDIGFWPITYIKDINKFTSYGSNILNPIFKKNINKEFEKKICNSLFDILNELCNELNVKEFQTEENFHYQDLFISNWHTANLNYFPEIQIEYQIYVNLKLGYEKIRSFYRKSYKSLINKSKKKLEVKILDIKDKVIFTGFLAGEYKNSALIDSDIVVQLSRQEQGAWAPLEAVLCETPIVVTSHTGTGEDIKRLDAGYLVDFDDIEGLCKIFNHIFENYELAMKKTIKAKKHIELNLSFNSRVGEYTNIYPAVTIAAIAISMNVFVDWLLKKSSAKLSEEI
mgnify:CR=1 FL=1